jgi:hypothetical protein
MSEAQNFWLLLLRYGYASAPHQQPKIPKESMTNLLNLTHTTPKGARSKDPERLLINTGLEAGDTRRGST